jgi:SAM-dependent methyltransferase
MFDLGERNKRAWDDLYGATDQPVWGRLPIGFLHEFLGYVTPTLGPSSRVLDAGGGEGRNVRALEQTRAWVCLCDASAHGLKKVRSVVHARVPCAQCDLGSLPFENDLFDLVLMTDVVETLPDPHPALAEASRVLKPGGMLLCNIPGAGDPIADTEMDVIGEEAYLYRGRYFYRFVDAQAGAELMRQHRFDIARSEARTWTEEAHPSFRAYAHQHVSNVFLAVKT